MAAQLDRAALYFSGVPEIPDVWFPGLQCSSIGQRLMDMVSFPTPASRHDKLSLYGSGRPTMISTPEALGCLRVSYHWFHLCRYASRNANPLQSVYNIKADSCEILSAGCPGRHKFGHAMCWALG